MYTANSPLTAQCSFLIKLIIFLALEPEQQLLQTQHLKTNVMVLDVHFYFLLQTIIIDYLLLHCCDMCPWKE